MSDTDKRQEPESPTEEELPVDESAEKESPAAEEAAAEESPPVEEPAVKEPAVEEPAVEEPAIVEPEDEPVEPVEPARVPEDAPPKVVGRGLGWLALAVSAVALAAVAYTLFVDWSSQDDSSADEALTELRRQLGQDREQLANLDALVAEIAGRDSVSAADIDAVRKELEGRVELLNSLPPRMSTLESSVASLAGISEGARDTFLLAEAEYYMQIANAQLQLANNPHLASLALAMADERVVQLANPALTDVRQQIADELAALAIMEKPDIAGTTMTLASLARVVESLPVASRQAEVTDTQEETDAEQSGVGRAWSSVKGAMSGLVKVTPPDQAGLTLLTPDAEYFLRNNIALQLQAARLALLRGEQAVFEQSLDDTSALLQQYFDTESAQVAGALSTLEEIRGNVFASAAPDISGSLELLRQFQALRENSQ